MWVVAATGLSQARSRRSYGPSRASAARAYYMGSASARSTRGHLLQRRLQVLRQGRLELEVAAVARVVEAQPVSVQKLPPHELRPPAVHRVAHEGVAQAGEVDADLVRPPRRRR